MKKSTNVLSNIEDFKYFFGTELKDITFRDSKPLLDNFKCIRYQPERRIFVHRVLMIIVLSFKEVSSDMIFGRYDFPKF